MSIFTEDPVTVLEDVIVEVRSWATPLELGLGVTAYVHPGVVITAVSDGAIVHLAPGAHIEDLDSGALESAAVTVTPWTAYPQIPPGLPVSVLQATRADELVGRFVSAVVATPCTVRDLLRAHAEATTAGPSPVSPPSEG